MTIYSQMACDINTVDMPQASATQGIPSNPDKDFTGLDLGLLGTEYERKKQKLMQDLQLDYKCYVGQKKNQKTTEPHPQPQSLFSLPIDERTSVKEKLREERKKEYNLFLQEQAQTRRLKRPTSPVFNYNPGHLQASEVAGISSPAEDALPIQNSHAASRRDATTMTEAKVDGTNGKGTGPQCPGRRRRRRWHLYRPKEHYSSEEELNKDYNGELGLRHRRCHNTHTPEPEYKEEKRTKEPRADRASRVIKEVEAPVFHEQNNNDRISKSDLQLPDWMTTPSRSRPASPKEKAKFATGLVISTTQEEQMASQMKKEHYKQELLKQIAEQQMNRMREKELKFATTGARDPDKKSDRIRAVNQQYDSWRSDVPNKSGIGMEAAERGPNPEQSTHPGKVQVPLPPLMVENTTLTQLPGWTEPEYGSGAPRGGPSCDFINENCFRDFSGMRGELATPRVAGVPPPPPAVTNTYKTPYDATYYYYGARNPLDPNPPDYQNGLPGGVQQSGNFHNPSRRPPSVKPSHGIVEASPLVIGEVSQDNSKQKRESAMNHQKALREQIREREERKRREKEEKERHDAKIEAEIRAYNPWGRSGGGAPIRDQRGNLVSDLNKMHRINEELYRKPATKTHDLEVEAETPTQISGFTDLPTPQPLHMHDAYKKALTQQVEENRRKKLEERELMRIEEEKEEKRLAEQRARIQQEYEEEQRKQKKIGHGLENQFWIHEGKPHHHMEEKRVMVEQEIEEQAPVSTKDKEEKQAPFEREASPPIPNFQNKQTNLVASGASSSLSQLSSRNERFVSAPNAPFHSTTYPLHDDKQEVMRKLSAIRRHLRKEQRQLEVQMGQTDQQETHYSPLNRLRGRPRVDAFEPADKQAVRTSSRSPSAIAACSDIQNIREFNQLKYRDTASREQVRHMFPDPPTDAQSLDVQQQALLHEQQRKIRLMRREKEHDCLGQQLNHHRSRNNLGRHIHRDSMLTSETTFIDVYSGDPSGDLVHPQRSLQPSAEQQERRHEHEKAAASMDQRERDIQPAQSPQSVSTVNLESKVSSHSQQRSSRSARADLHRTSRSDGLSGDGMEALSLGSALERRVSVETVATEAWLRPGTSDAVKHIGCKERADSRRDAPP